MSKRRCRTNYVALNGSVAAGASGHPAVASSHPSIAKLQKEITALNHKIAKSYLSDAKAKATYLSDAKANTTVIKGEGSIVLGSVAIPDAANDSAATLLTTPSGLTFKVLTSSGFNEFVADNNTSHIQRLLIGSQEHDVNPETSTAVSLGPTSGSGQFDMQILRSQSPLVIDTLSLAEFVDGAQITFFGQLVHAKG